MQRLVACSMMQLLAEQCSLIARTRVCVCVCASCVYAFYARNAMSATKQKRQVFFEWPATKQAKDCDERKETKCSGKSEFALKGEQTFSAFWFLCKLNKKGSVLFFFSSVFTRSLLRRERTQFFEKCKAA